MRAHQCSPEACSSIFNLCFVLTEFNGDVMVERHMERLGGRDRLYFQIFSAVNTDRPKENLDIALRAHGMPSPFVGPAFSIATMAIWPCYCCCGGGCGNCMVAEGCVVPGAGREMIAAVGAEVDRLEAIIRKAMPSIRHIDLVCLVKHSY